MRSLARQHQKFEPLATHSLGNESFLRNRHVSLGVSSLVLALMGIWPIGCTPSSKESKGEFGINRLSRSQDSRPEKNTVKKDEGDDINDRLLKISSLTGREAQREIVSLNSQIAALPDDEGKIIVGIELAAKTLEKKCDIDVLKAVANTLSKALASKKAFSSKELRNYAYDRIALMQKYGGMNFSDSEHLNEALGRLAKSDAPFNKGELPLQTLDGKPITLNLKNFRGKTVLINFWATWCGPCVDEMPYLDEIAKANKNSIVIVGISPEAPTPVNSFLKKNGVSYLMYLGLPDKGGQQALSQFGVSLYPTSIVIGPDGTIVNRFVGERTKAGFEGELGINSSR